jgi:hypothetical protein
MSVAAPTWRTNLTWLPFCVVSTKPAASRRRLTSRNGRGLSRPNLDLDCSDLGWPSRVRRLEVELQRFFQIGERFFFGFALAGNIDFKALRDIPVAFAPNRCREWTFHKVILAQDSRRTNSESGQEGSDRYRRALFHRIQDLPSRNCHLLMYGMP